MINVTVNDDSQVILSAYIQIPTIFFEVFGNILGNVYIFCNSWRMWYIISLYAPHHTKHHRVINKMLFRLYHKERDSKLDCVCVYVLSEWKLPFSSYTTMNNSLIVVYNLMPQCTILLQRVLCVFNVNTKYVTQLQYFRLFSHSKQLKSWVLKWA